MHLLCSRNLSRHWNSSSQDRHSPCPPGADTHGGHAEYIRQTHELKRLIDDAREWNWVTCYDRWNGSGACFSEEWCLSWHLKNEKVLAFQSSGGKQAPGNKDNGCTGPDTGLSKHSKWPLFSVNYTDQTVAYSIPKLASLTLLHFIQTGNTYWCFPGGSAVKNLPAMQETQVWSLDQEDALEEVMATHSSILAWRIPWTEKPGGLQFIASQRVGLDWSDWAPT